MTSLARMWVALFVGSVAVLVLGSVMLDRGWVAAGSVELVLGGLGFLMFLSMLLADTQTELRSRRQEETGDGVSG